VKAGSLVGAVLILLASALGLTSYLVDAQVPQRLLVLIQERIHSPVVFLLALNVFTASCSAAVLEIYAAIVVLAPLVAPAGGRPSASTRSISASSSSPIWSSGFCFPRPA